MINSCDNNKLVTFLALGLAGLILATGLRLFLPFFEPIAWAIILALFFYPVYKWMRRALKVSEALASLGMCILIIAFIIIPVFGLLGSLTTEVIRVYTSVQEDLHTGDFNIVPDKDKSPILNKTVNNALDILKTHETRVKEILIDLSKKMGEFFLKQGTVMFKNVASIIFKAALMLVTLFYIFKDGERMLQTFKDLLPLPKRDVENLVKAMDDVLSATLYGNLLNAFIQGSVGFFIMWMLDFSAPLLWGMIMGFTTFIPMIGPALVWFPAVIYLFLSGFYLKAAVLLAFSILIISQIDYFLRPLFISGKTQIHTLILLLSILGGLSVFGFLGLILGPILMALCVSILELYRLNSLGRTQEEG
ncbi:MAG: AI-2E family transporter [Deltaproteobacteria bacterium]|nr:AI-2E family transporter [Deltaproteobacteria bacterium]MBW1938138.1 AI-2E family transporter [Deltaproteobacteria bacterium]MBW1965352.1 AI-2E family transporter [Deltaproteobacteria bacterium]MBW2080094.1 AI-2E family transporter [Deltaproteobacteria bacterium]MBW2351001.1 AI-2E family transporter [Deltaproteobacteria bacterium]